jgi:hypothetical protein
MLDNIIVKVPDKLELRAYTWQLISKSFEFSKYVRDCLSEMNSGFCTGENHMNLDVVSDDEIMALLDKCWRIPEYIYFFNLEFEIYEGKYLECDYKKMPEFFTNIGDVYYLNNKIELIVLQHFDWQVYTIYDRYLKCLLGYCDNILIGIDGKIFLSFADGSLWHYYQYDGNKLKKIEICFPTEVPEDFFPVQEPKVEIYHPDTSKNPTLILRHKEISYKNNKSVEDESGK